MLIFSFISASTHVGMDVVPVGDFIDSLILFNITESIGMDTPVVHWIRFLGGFVFLIMLLLPKPTLILILILIMPTRHIPFFRELSRNASY